MTRSMGGGSAAVGLVAGVLAVVLAVAGCGAKNFNNDNDALRAERAELREQVAERDARIAELEAKLAEARRAAQAPLDDEVAAAMPRVTGVTIQRPLFREDGVVAVVGVVDGRRRAVQAVGTLVLEVAALSEQVGGEPELLASVTLTPTELRDAYVSGFGGTGYRVEAPTGAIEPGRSVTLRAVLTDAVTGVVHKAESLYEAR